ncbi:MAG: prepilin peptidase [Clostridia bacterium]|nr:prepilin peptidase [Clostridia bacterium]
MYFNNLHILWFVLIASLGLVVGKIVSYIDDKLVNEKKIFTKDFFKEVVKNYDYNYLIMLSISGIYVFLLYKFGFKENFLKNLDLFKYLILTPMLVSTFFIDLKHRIIPNRLNMTIFEVGILVVLVYGYNNINIAKDMLFGMFIGAGIFLTITLLGGLIAGKEAMGLGDVKFMGAIGLFFGGSNIAQITLLAFFIAAIASVIILAVRILILKKKDEYIPFGPFLVISAIACIFLKQDWIWTTFLKLCTNISDVIINFI